MTTRELIAILSEMPPETAICVQSLLTNEPRIVQQVRVRHGSLVLYDHMLCRNTAVVCTSVDGQEYVISYDSPIVRG
jgi:hypothetical protein